MSIPHRIIRTRNKHSHAVLRDAEIVIRLARNLSSTEERRHIENLLRRMTKYAALEQCKTAVDPFRLLLSGSDTNTVQLPSGRSYVFALAAGTRTSAVYEDGTWTVTVSPHVRRRALHGYLWKLLSDAERPHIEASVAAINDETLRVPLSRVGLRFTPSQWGSCSRGGAVSLSTALLFVPLELQRYVIVHELAHCLHQNHSARFWREVGRHVPSYQEARRDLAHFRMTRL